MTEQEACEMFEDSSIQELKKKIVFAIQFAFIGLILEELGVDGFDGFDQRFSDEEVDAYCLAMDRLQVKRDQKKQERKNRKDGRD